MSAIIVPMDKIRTARRLAIAASATREIGLRIMAARLALGMSQADLCKLLDMDSSQISQWETGKHRPSLDAVVQLLPFLEVDLDYVFLGDIAGFPWAKRDALQNAYEQALAEDAERQAAKGRRRAAN
jgi:transcriptional regulator with XRE-family HTH domain